MFVVYETYKKDFPQHNYIGKSSEERFTGRNKYRGTGLHLNNARKKYGKNRFDYRFLAKFDNEDEAYEYEAKMIEEMKPYYNIASGGKGAGSGKRHHWYGKVGTATGRVMSDEEKAHLRRVNIGKRYSQEVNDKKGSSGTTNPRWRDDLPETSVMLEWKENNNVGYRKTAEHFGMSKSGLMRRAKAFRQGKE